MELWIPITIAAAFLQNLRSALQKHLQGKLGTRGASFVRFGYGFPLAILYAAALHGVAAAAVLAIDGNPLAQDDTAMEGYDPFRDVVRETVDAVVTTALEALTA